MSAIVSPGASVPARTATAQDYSALAELAAAMKRHVKLAEPCL